MESEGSLPSSQQPAISPYPESDQCRPRPFKPFREYPFNIILSSKPSNIKKYAVNSITIYGLSRHFI